MVKEYSELEKMEIRIVKLEIQLEEAKKKMDFFVEPFLLKLSNKNDESSVFTLTYPFIMRWIESAFFMEQKKERQKFLKELHERFKREIPMDLSKIKDLQIPKEEDLSGIFEK